MADKLIAPEETIFDEEGAVLIAGLGLPIILASPYAPLIAPENFTDYQTPQGNAEALFG